MSIRFMLIRIDTQHNLEEVFCELGVLAFMIRLLKSGLMYASIGGLLLDVELLVKSRQSLPGVGETHSTPRKVVWACC